MALEVDKYPRSTELVLSTVSAHIVPQKDYRYRADQSGKLILNKLSADKTIPKGTVWAHYDSKTIEAKQEALDERFRAFELKEKRLKELDIPLAQLTLESEINTLEQLIEKQSVARKIINKLSY